MLFGYQAADDVTTPLALIEQVAGDRSLPPTSDRTSSSPAVRKGARRRRTRLCARCSSSAPARRRRYNLRLGHRQRSQAAVPGRVEGAETLSSHRQAAGLSAVAKIALRSDASVEPETKPSSANAAGSAGEHERGRNSGC